MRQLIYQLKRYYHFFKTGLRGWLAQIATGHPERQLKIILVTGTDGKTTTSSLIYHLLRQSGFKVALLSTVAAYIGEEKLDTGFHVTSPAPQDLYRYMRRMVDAGMEYLVLELTSQGAYQWRGWGIHGEVTALTNIDRDHLDYHLNFDNYLMAKMLVVNASKVAVVNDELPCFSQVKKRLRAGVELVTFNKGTRFSAPLEKAVRETFREDYNRLNAILALTVAKQFKLTDKQLEKALTGFQLPEGRMQVIPNRLGFTMIVDFAHTPQALSAVLPAIRKEYVRGTGKLIGIVGAAGLRDRTKRAPMGRLMAQHCDVVIFTSEDPRTENPWSIIQQMKEDLGTYHDRVISIVNREEALKFAINTYGGDDNVIAIFGKGHEQSMNYDGVHETLWNDIAGAQTIIAERENGDGEILKNKHFFLVGVKGVGMTSLASCLLDAGKKVTGADVSDRFVTSRNLDRLGVPIQPLDGSLPDDVDVVIYSGAHGGRQQQLVQEASKRGIPVFSHMQALAWFFNAKKGVAVCGVGGKSTISAMLSFVSQRIRPQSYSVGVGEIINLPKTGQYLPDSDYFIAEADEYVADPTTIGTPEMHIRFLYLRPQIIICPNLRFDHPDVYRDLAHTKEVFLQFFCQLKKNGTLIYNGDDPELAELAGQLKTKRPDVMLISFGRAPHNDRSLERENIALSVPGEFNQVNALAALIAAEQMGLDSKRVRRTLKTYASVKRRLEHIGERHGVEIWDDYAHHPSEVTAVIKAFQEKFPQRRLVFAFQPHTFSRTKELFDEFVAALGTAREVWLLDIYPSAREEFDPSISSADLVKALERQFADQTKVELIGPVSALAAACDERLQAGDVLVTVGAGDIYQAFRED